MITSTTPTTSSTSVSGSSSSSSTGSSSAAASSSTDNTVDYNTFLQLLVTELQNQDPTNPADPTQYLSQLASFSAVGQAVQTNSKLDTMITSSALSQAESAIGKTVTSADGKTSGVVSSVAIGTDGTVTATLKSGSTLALGNGVTVSQ